MTTVTSENRIAQAIERCRAINPPAILDGLAEKLALTFEEFVAYQQTQAIAYSKGVLRLHEANLIHSALGDSWSPSNGGWASGTDAATKVVVTKALGELAGIS